MFKSQVILLSKGTLQNTCSGEMLKIMRTIIIVYGNSINLVIDTSIQLCTIVMTYL